jgi:sugar phosphate permease
VAVLFACIGLGRFSLGMLLPSMGTDLGLSYSQMGAISTGNFVGYLAGVLLAGLVARRTSPRWAIFIGLLLVGGTMVLISFSGGFYTILWLYIVTGVGSSIANLPLVGLISHWFLASLRGRAAGSMLAGNALAIVFAGFYVPWLNAGGGGDAWRTGWLVMGIIALGVAVVAAVLIRNHPSEKGLSPLGTAFQPRKAATGTRSGSSLRGIMVHLGTIFFIFGATQVVYATFIVTALVTERGFGEATAGIFWSVVGGFSIFSGQLFGWISDRLGRRSGMIIVYVLFAVSFALAATNLPDVFLFISIVVFGLCMWSIPTIMYAAVGDYLGPDRATDAIGFITLFCGAGQVVGPAVAGGIAERAGTFHGVFGLCAALAVAAVGLAYFLRPSKS